MDKSKMLKAVNMAKEIVLEEIYLPLPDVEYSVAIAIIATKLYEDKE